MSNTASLTSSSSIHSSFSDADFSWPTAFSDTNDMPSLSSAAAYSNLLFQPHDVSQPAYYPPPPRAPRMYEQTWFTLDADLLESSHIPSRSSLSPLPLTSVVNSLYLPHVTLPFAHAPHQSDESDSTNSPTSLASSPPPLSSSAEPEPAHNPHYSFPADPLPPTSPPPSLLLSSLLTTRKRGKADESERAARAERKRRRHRAIDLARRQRETTAVQRLNQLITPTHNSRPATDDDSNIAAGGDEKRDKVTVLEAAVQQLADLQQLVAQLTYNNNVQHDQLHAARFQLQQTQNALTHLDDETRSHSIYSSAFLSASLSFFLVSVGTGLVLDANARLFQCTGWQRHHVIGRMLTAPYQHLIHRNSLSKSERLQRDQQRLLIENEQRQMVPARNVQQYESSRQALLDVSAGVRDQIHAVWRLYVRDGRLCELPGTCWGGEMEEVVEGEGDEVRRYRRPKHIIFAFSFSDAVLMD